MYGGGAFYNSPIFCAVCPGAGEKRDNQAYFGKLNWFVSTKGLGSHNMVGGYDAFNGSRLSNNWQSGSSYFVYGDGIIYQGGEIYPVIDTGTTTLSYYPIFNVGPAERYGYVVPLLQRHVEAERQFLVQPRRPVRQEPRDRRLRRDDGPGQQVEPASRGDLGRDGEGDLPRQRHVRRLRRRPRRGDRRQRDGLRHPCRLLLLLRRSVDQQPGPAPRSSPGRRRFSRSSTGSASRRQTSSRSQVSLRSPR